MAGVRAAILSGSIASIGSSPRLECLIVFGIWDVGQPILAAPPFEAASRSTTETDLAVAKPRLLSPAKSRLKGGCSQDWLPHVLVAPALIYNHYLFVIGDRGLAVRHGPGVGLSPK
jgi:hypothetical protein